MEQSSFRVVNSSLCSLEYRTMDKVRKSSNPRNLSWSRSFLSSMEPEASLQSGILTAVTITVAVFWGVAPCSALSRHQCFAKTFYPEKRGNVFLRNVSICIINYKLNECIIITIMDIIHRPVFLFKKTRFRRLDSASVFRWNLLRFAQYKRIDSFSEHEAETSSV
jgi:hypothetical protein